MTYHHREDPAETARWEAEKRADRMEPPVTDTSWLRMEPLRPAARPWDRGLVLAKLVAFLTFDVLCAGRIFGWW